MKIYSDDISTESQNSDIVFNKKIKQIAVAGEIFKTTPKMHMEDVNTIYFDYLTCKGVKLFKTMPDSGGELGKIALNMVIADVHEMKIRNRKVA